MKEKVLELKEKGLTHKEISEILGINKSTISYHLNRKDKILSKQRLKRKRKKQELVDYKGGKCIKCGYNKCIDALDFHHRDPSSKEFEVNVSKVYDIEKLKKEADKCDLLCLNCHREVHAKIRDSRIL